MSSLLSDRGRPGVLHYTVSKTALLGLIRTVATEWGPHGIRANGVAPGYISTEMTRPLQEDEGFNQMVLSRTPIGRWGLPEDIAPVAAFLSSDAAGYVNGQVLYVDGGWIAGL
jgi:gluconate 5-dehydrogenase